MPDVSASIVALIGAVLIGLGCLSSSTTEDSRQRLARFGWLILVIGLIAWAVAFVSKMDG